MESIHQYWFEIMLATGLAWLALLEIIFAKIKRDHPDKYKQMEQPRVFDISIKTTFYALKFVGKREHKTLNNPLLSWISDLSLILFVMYIITFIIGP